MGTRIGTDNVKGKDLSEEQVQQQLKIAKTKRKAKMRKKNGGRSSRNYY